MRLSPAQKRLVAQAVEEKIDRLNQDLLDHESGIKVPVKEVRTAVVLLDAAYEELTK